MKDESEADELADNSITEEELLLVARRSFLFLSACVNGEIADAKVADRIMAARALLEHAVKVPRLFDELLTSVVELSDEDIGLIATALDQLTPNHWIGNCNVRGQPGGDRWMIAVSARTRIHGRRQRENRRIQVAAGRSGS